ncbi:MAG: GLPGLI family protein [Janthinobacterium lividum]
MLRTYLTATLASFCSLPGLAQAPTLSADLCRTECFYRLTYRPDSTVEATRTDQLRLQIGSKLSRFESRNAVYHDSVMAAVFDQANKTSGLGETRTIDLRGRGLETRRPSTTAVIYKVSGAQQVAVYDKIGTVAYTYQEPATLLTWAITPDKATVAGYACQRATTTLGGRTWEAWFTREVPLAEGPYKFYGLPGLIVKVNDTRNAYSFELVKLRQLPAPVAIAPPMSAKTTSRAEFRQAKANHDRNGLAMLSGSGDSSTTTSISGSNGETAADMQRMAQANAKKRNNPLELR